MQSTTQNVFLTERNQKARVDSDHLISYIQTERKTMINKLLKLSKLFENFINNTPGLDETGHGTFLDGKKSERDIDVRYKGVDYVLTIRRMGE
jgi:hypothetical protein|tara:strand:- start:230 stop:508 length:279 start_codon:yes stop_codon:yes gene_type:complete